MKFSGNVLNGTKNKGLDFGSNLDHWIMWIQAARCVCVQDNSKTYGWISMKFLEYV